MYTMIVMHEFSTEVPKSIEMSGERLVKKVMEIIKQRDNEIAVEVYGSGIGRLDEDSVTQEQLDAEAVEVSLKYRDDLIGILDGSSVEDDVLALYDISTAADTKQGDLSEQLSRLILDSVEHTTEVEERERGVKEDYQIARVELPIFLDSKILDNQGDRAVMSKWGNAKLAYEKGDSSNLKTLLEDYLRSLENDTERGTIERFLRFL